MAKKIWQTLSNALVIAALIFTINYVCLQQYEQTYSQLSSGNKQRVVVPDHRPLASLLFNNTERVAPLSSNSPVATSNTSRQHIAVTTPPQKKTGDGNVAVKANPIPQPHTDMYSHNHELKLARLQEQIDVDPLDTLLERQARVQQRYIASDLALGERKERAMLELCTKQVTCYGLGDRFYGVMANFLVALMGGKAFFIVHNKPADLNLHMEPNKIDWHVDSVRHAGVKAELLNLDHCQEPTCARVVLELPVVPGKRLVDGANVTAPIVYSWGNARTDVFFEAMALAQLFPRLKGGMAAWSEEDRRFWASHTSSRLWNYLFKYTDSLKAAADDLLKAAFKTPEPYSFERTMLCTPCVHARTGYGLREVPRHVNKKDFATCMRKVGADVARSTDERCAAHRSAGSRFIVLSDSSSFIDEMKETFKGHSAIFSTSGTGPLVHAETIQLGSDNAVRGLRRAMIDYYILSHCRYHVASLSTFDGTASIAHGAEVRRYDMETSATCKDTPNNIGVWQRDVHAKPKHW